MQQIVFRWDLKHVFMCSWELICSSYLDTMFFSTAAEIFDGEVVGVLIETWPGS